MEKVDILIHNCTILPMNGRDIVENGAIAIKDGRIVFLGRSTRVSNMEAEKEINAKEKVAMPGLVNCHTHVPMTLFRGIAEDLTLEDWLREIIWPLEAKLDSDDVYDGALLGCLEMIKSGTTCFADMYFHEDMVAKAVIESGLRGVLAEGVIEVGDGVAGVKTLSESLDFARTFDGCGHSRVTAFLGPHAAYSCSPELLIKIVEKTSELNLGIHIHLAESTEISKDFEREFRSSEVEFLDRIGLFEGHVLAAHCINLSQEDMHILSKRKVHVTYVPVANMKLGLGAAKIKELADLNVNISLGTDGPASNNTLDMFETMKISALLQKLVHLNPTIFSTYEVLNMATIDGARALGLEKEIGSLEVGKKGDMILLDFSKPHMKPVHDICAGIVYSARGTDVDTVIVDGQIIMENRQVRTLDEQTVTERADKRALDLLNR